MAKMPNLLPWLFNLLVSDSRAVNNSLLLGEEHKHLKACMCYRDGDVFDKISFQSGASTFLKSKGKGTKEEEREGQTFSKTPEMTTIEQPNISRFRDRSTFAQKLFWCRNIIFMKIKGITSKQHP